MSRAGRILQRVGLNVLSPSADMIDVYQIAGTAMDVADEPWPAAPVDERVTAELADYLRQVTPRIAEFTGLELAVPSIGPVVFNRSEWIAVTARNLKPVFELMIGGIYGLPASEEEDEKPGRLMKAAMAAEIGCVIGYLSRRVLGQYDVSFIAGDDRPGALYFIYPNIHETEERLGVDSCTFRLWLTLHEATHSFEFEAHPWIKVYLRQLIEEHSDYVRARLRRAASASGGEKSLVERLPALIFSGAMRELISPEENPILAKAQALMSILEGYSEYVMGALGADLIEGSWDLTDRLDRARTQRSWFHQVIERLIGIQVKLEQYRLGRLFIERAADVGGIELVNHVWRDARHMPTLTEIRQPELWITRMLKE